MSEINESTVAAATPVEAPKKRRARGINNETRGESRKKFDERRDMNKTNGLFLGHLDEIKVTESEMKDDANLKSFAGLVCPRLTLTFASNQENANDRRYVTMSFGPVESNAETIPGGKSEWKVNQILNTLKHILNVYVLKGREMTEEEEDALCLDFEDFDENFAYVPVEPEQVLAGYKHLFENFTKIMENGGKPYYKAANGGILPIWMKLLRATKNKNKWTPVVNGNTSKGDLGFPTFVGEGVIELYKSTEQPMLHIDITKESVIPVKFDEPEETPKTPNVGPVAAVPFGAPGGFGGAPIDPMQAAVPNEFGAGVGVGPDGLPF